MPLAVSARPAGYTVETITLQGTVGELTTHGMPCNLHVYVTQESGSSPMSRADLLWWCSGITASQSTIPAKGAAPTVADAGQAE